MSDWQREFQRQGIERLKQGEDAARKPIKQHVEQSGDAVANVLGRPELRGSKMADFVEPPLRELRKFYLDGLTDEALQAEWQRFYGDGTTWAVRSTAIETFLRDEFGGPKRATVTMHCPTCNADPPHYTPGRPLNEDGRAISEFECVACRTWTKQYPV